jgi:uncharacterized protein YihD (DUF1040 family)
MFHFSDEFIDLLQDYLRQEPGIDMVIFLVSKMAGKSPLELHVSN